MGFLRGAFNNILTTCFLLCSLPVLQMRKALSQLYQSISFSFQRPAPSPFLQDGSVVKSQASGVQIPVLLLAQCVTLIKLLHISKP